MQVFGTPKARLTEEARNFIDLYVQLGERAENFLPERIFDSLTQFVRLCYEEPDDPATQEAEIRKYILELKESIPGYVDVSLMLMPHEDSKAFRYSSLRTNFHSRLLELMDTEQVDEKTRKQFNNILHTHDYSLGTPPVTQHTIDFLYTILLGDHVLELRKFRDLIGISSDVEEAQWNYMLDVMDQMVNQSTHYTSSAEKNHFINRSESTVNFKGLNGFMRTVVSGNADTAIELLAGEVFSPEMVRVIEFTTPETLYEEIRDDAVHIFAIKIPNMRKNPFKHFRWFPLLTRMIFIDDSPESRASNTSLVFCFHNGILNTLNNVHNKKLGAMANSQLNLRLILEKVNLNNIRKFKEAIEKKIQAYDRELKLLAKEQLAGEDNPEREIILYKFDEFSRQVIRDKYILSKFGAFISFVENMKDPEKARETTKNLIREFEDRTRAYFYSENKKLQIATVVEGGGRNQIRTYAEYLLRRPLKAVKPEIIERCRIILDVIPDIYQRTLEIHFHKNFGLNLFLEKYKEYLTKVENEADNRGRLMNFLIDLGIDKKYMSLPEKEQKIIREFISGLANVEKTSVSDDVQMIIRDLLFFNNRKPNPFIFYNQEASWEYKDLFPADRFDLNPFDIDIELNDEGRVDWERLLKKMERIKNTFQLFDESGSLWDRFCENSTLIINDPANPSGFTDFNNIYLIRFLKFLNNSKITLFLDEAYNDAVKIEDPEEPKWRTISRYIMNNIGSYAKISVVSSLSTTKNLGATGDRLGSLIATPARRDVIEYARARFGTERGNANSLYMLVNIMEVAQLAKRIKDRMDENLPKDASRYKIKEKLKGYILAELEQNRHARRKNSPYGRRPSMFEGSPLHLFLLEELVNLDRLDVLDLPDDFKYKGEPFFSYYKNHLVSELNRFRVNKIFRSESNKRLKLAKETVTRILEETGDLAISVLDSDGSYLFNLHMRDFFSFQDLEKFTMKLASERGLAFLPYQKGFVRLSLGDYLEGSEESYRIFTRELDNVIRIFLKYWKEFYDRKKLPENKYLRSEELLDEIFRIHTDQDLIDRLFEDFNIIKDLQKVLNQSLKISDIKTLYHPFPKVSGVNINYISDSRNAVFEFYENIGKCRDLKEFISSKAFTKVYENLLPQIYKKIPVIKDLDINDVIARYGKPTLLKYITSKIEFQPDDYILDNPDELNSMKEILIELENILFSDAKVKILALNANEQDVPGDLARLEGYNQILRKYIRELLFYFNLPFENEGFDPSYAELVENAVENFEEVIRKPAREINLFLAVSDYMSEIRKLKDFQSIRFAGRFTEVILQYLSREVLETDKPVWEKILLLYLLQKNGSFRNRLLERLQVYMDRIEGYEDPEARLYVEDLITKVMPEDIRQIINEIVAYRNIKIPAEQLHDETRNVVLFVTGMMNRTKNNEYYKKYNHFLIKLTEVTFQRQNSALNEMIQHGIAIYRNFTAENELTTWNRGALNWINSLMSRCGVIAWEQPVQMHTRIATDSKKREYPYHKVDRPDKEKPHARVLEDDSPNEFIKNMQSRPSSGFFAKRMREFVENLDEEDYRCKIVRHGLVREMYIFQKSYLKYLTDNFRLVQREFIPLKEVKSFVPDVIYFLGAPEKVLSYPSAGYFDLKGPKGHIKVIVTPLKKAMDYFGNIKKPRLTMLNEKIKEKGGMPVHGSLFAVEENDGTLFVIQVSGDSGVGKSEMIAAMMLKWMRKNLPGVRSIKLIAGDMFHVFPDKEGNLYGIGTEVGDFSRVTDFNPDFIKAYQALFETSADSNVEDLNSRSTISGLCDISMPYKIDIMLTAYNFGREEAGVKRYANPENFVLYRDSHGERKEKATSSDNPNIQRTLLRYTADPKIVRVIDTHGNYLDHVLGWEKDGFTGKIYLASTYKLMDKIDIEDVVNQIFEGKVFIKDGTEYLIRRVKFDIIKNRFQVLAREVFSEEKKEKRTKPSEISLLLDRTFFSTIFDSLASTPAGNPFISEYGEHEMKMNLIRVLKGGRDGQGKGKSIQLGILSTDLGKKGKEITGPEKAAEDLLTLIREVRILRPEINEQRQYVKQRIIEAYGPLFIHHKHSLEVWRYNYLLYQLEKMRKAQLVRMDNPEEKIDMSGLQDFNPLPEDHEFSPLLITPNINIELSAFSETYEQLMWLPNNREFSDELFRDCDKLYIARDYSRETIVNNMVLQLLLMNGYIGIEDINQARITEKVNRETIAAAKYACVRKLEEIVGAQGKAI
ncbi:MAG: aminotransferase class I/II-fold pyridoxal phosphate-dependent enzyme [Bacteroidales bacterium]|nr:aminotransferase class I/II-fold pyridoxal phosphate-dependent enzyme [Bacteroidales bacterium]